MRQPGSRSPTRSSRACRPACRGRGSASRAGEVCNALGDFVAAEAHHRAGAADLVGQDDLVLRAHLDNKLGSLAVRVGRLDEGIAAMGRSVEATRRAGVADGNLEYREAALARFRDDAEGEDRWLERAVVAARAVGNRPLQVHAQLFLGISARNDGRFGEARRIFEGILALGDPGDAGDRPPAPREHAGRAGRRGRRRPLDGGGPGARAGPRRRPRCLLRPVVPIRRRPVPRRVRRRHPLPQSGRGRGRHLVALPGDGGQIVAARANVALRRGRFGDAIRLGRRAVAAYEAYPRDPSEALAGLAMAHLAAGDLIEARRTFGDCRPEPRAYLAVRLCPEAVLVAGGGERPGALLARARDEADRSERPIGPGNVALVRALLGDWARASLG